MKVLVTGAAGFIGMHVARRLLERGDEVVGVDNLNDYYDVALKEARLRELAPYPKFRFVKLDLAEAEGVAALFRREGFAAVVHLAAQPGVRYSLRNPLAYVQSNLAGFAHILEGCRHGRVGHLVYASSSSVYGGNTRMPFSEHDPVDHPVSLYAATKRSNELMAHAYSHLYGLPATGLRFFTVYGPWGRPDMAYWSFAEAILEGRPIEVFNEGRMQRDFTYIEDIVAGVLGVLDRPAAPAERFDTAAPDPAASWAPWRIYNIGNHQPVALLEFIATLERALGRRATLHFKPMQPGDVVATYADIDALGALTGFAPTTPLAAGIERFVAWYRDWQGRARA